MAAHARKREKRNIFKTKPKQKTKNKKRKAVGTVGERRQRDGQEAKPIKEKKITWVSPLLIFCVGMLLTALVWYGLSSRTQQDSQDSFALRANDISTLLNSTAEAHITELFDASAFLSSDAAPPSQEAVENYVRVREAYDKDSPFYNILYIESVPQGQLDTLLARERAIGNPFTLGEANPVPASGNHMILTRIVPSAPVTFGDIGLDISQDSSFESILSEAANKREASLISTPPELSEQLENSTGDTSEFIFIIPIYRDETSTVSGWLVANFAPTKLLEPALGRDKNSMTVIVNIINEDKPVAFKYGANITSKTAAYQYVGNFETRGLTWNYGVWAKQFGKTDNISLLVLITGLALSSLLGFFMWYRSRADEEKAEVLSELTQTKEKITTDELTGLLNRQGINEALTSKIDNAIQTGGEVTVLFMDMNRFKLVNDTLGHKVGDELLICVANRLQNKLRNEDSVARFGGDEFIVVCNTNKGEYGMDALVDHVIGVFEEPVVLSSGTFNLSSSIGATQKNAKELQKALAKHKNLEELSDMLIRESDTAMYDAKHNNIPYKIFNNQMHTQISTRLDIETSLREALDQNSFNVVFQPIVDARTAELTSVEALLRWEVNGREISPEVFLPVAQEIGAMSQIGTYVLEETLKNLQRWEKQYAIKLKASINVAQQQLLDGNFTNEVTTLLKNYQVEPKQITLEMTEDMIVGNKGVSTGLLNNVASTGVNLSIDDFGTGRTSLSYIKNLTMVSELKIDKSLIKEIANNKVEKNIVEAVVLIAKAIPLDVVVEGVEEKTQWDELLKLGVDRLQGFYFHKPKPPIGIDSLLIATKKSI